MTAGCRDKLAIPDFLKNRPVGLFRQPLKNGFEKVHPL